MMIGQRCIVTMLLAVVLLGIGSWGAVAVHHDLTQNRLAFSQMPSAGGCPGQGTATTCLEAHVGILEQFTVVHPLRSFTVFVVLLLVVLLWWRLLPSHDTPSQWRSRLRWQHIFTYRQRHTIGRWLILHEKRDPPAVLRGAAWRSCWVRLGN